MTAANSLKGLAKLWADLRWRVGHMLDGVASRLLVYAPSVAKAYANLIAPRGPPLNPYPGWTFATEYYPGFQWMAWRRAALWDCARKRKLVVPLRVPWYDSTSVSVTLGNDQSMCLYVGGSFEPNEFAFLRKLLRPGMVAIDVGANEGLYTLFAAVRVGSGGRVIAVEPSSRERTNLRHNVDSNGLWNITIVASALGLAEGEASLQIAPDEHAGHNTLGTFIYDKVFAVNTELVPVETLDGLVERLGLKCVDFIKIDVEGAEVRVLSGARDTLRRLRPLLLLEVNEPALQAQGTSSSALIAMLGGGYSYDILVFSEQTGRVEVSNRNDKLSPNIVAVPAEKTVEVLAMAREASDAV